jgi:hypothetical protein
MGTRANIIIKYGLFEDIEKNFILLYRQSDGYPFCHSGVMYNLINAFIKNKELEGNEMSNYATYVISESFHKGIDYQTYLTTLCTNSEYLEYDAKGWFIDYAFKYIVSYYNKDDVTVRIETHHGSTGNLSILEWNKIAIVAKEIAITQINSHKIENDRCPCNECLVNSTCINGNKIMYPCEDLLLFKKGHLKELLKLIPTWSHKFVLNND